MDNQQVTDFEIGWLIGIFDGEGCYTLAKTVRHGDVSFTPGIKFVNTNFEIVEEVCRILKALGIAHYVYNSWRSGNQKPAKRIEIMGLLRIKKFLDALFPRMVCRVSQAKVLKDFVELRLTKSTKDPYTDDEWSMYHLLRSLNRQGTSETERDRS